MNRSESLDTNPEVHNIQLVRRHVAQLRPLSGEKIKCTSGPRKSNKIYFCQHLYLDHKCLGYRTFGLQVTLHHRLFM